MTGRACPSEVDLDRAFANAEPELVEHVAGCEHCRAYWNATTEALALARDLPADVPPAAHREELRTAVLAASAPRPPRSRRRTWVVPSLTLAAAAVAVIGLRRSPETSAPQAPAPSPSPNHATVHAHTGAVYALASDAPDEMVRLRDGTIDIDVRPLQHGERFRVVVGADEVEVRGTSFEVIAAADHLVAVHVVHGRVEVRQRGAAPVVLASGESLRATETAVAPSPAPLPAPAQLPAAPIRPPTARATPHGSISTAPAASKSEQVRPPDPQEAAFVVGWDAMRRNDFRTAAAAFAKVIALDRSGSLAEDAAFWHGVSLARMPRVADAIAALRDFIDDYPTSTRAGEASAMLGWLLVDTKELDEARRRFDAAIHDPSQAVQKSAREGLDVLARSQQ